MKQFRNIPLFKVFMSETSIKLTEETLRSGFIGQGPRVDEFEKKLKEHFNTDYLATLNSATSAEHLALHMIKSSVQNIKKPEILTTALTCTATNWPILANGFDIKWVDIDPETLNMDLDDLARKINKNTVAIVIVHWGGYPVDINKLNYIIHKSEIMYGHKPYVIQDCAHAMGSKYMGKLLGNESPSQNNFYTFSLQAIKHVTAGDGGILITPNMHFHKRAKLLRWYGIDRDDNRKDFRCEANIEEYGFKFHMNDINASIGLGNFSHMPHIIESHKENAAYYDFALKGIPGITLLKREQGFDSSFWIYSLLVERRDDFAKYMKEHGITTSQVHERNDIHTCVSKYRSILPNLDKTIGKVTSIPVGWWLSKEDREYIVETIKRGW